MPAKTLDLKHSKANTASKKKLNEDGFQKELDKKEKKTSDRDELSAAHHNDVENRQSVKKNTEPSRSALRHKVSTTKEKNANEAEKKSGAVAPTTAKANDNTPEKAAEVQQPRFQIAEQIKVAGDVASQEINIEAAQAEALQKLQLTQKMSSEGIALEGMTLINPEMLETNLLNPPSEVSPVATTELSSAIPSLMGVENQTLEAETGKGGEGQLSDLKLDQLSDALNSALQTHVKNKELNFESALKSISSPEGQAHRGANVDNIVQSAQTLLRDGGGEMKIILNPEGLGTVDLKVGVQGSEVSIEIIAQDNNVKKMFEDGISDIRSALELQNLKIDSFKVDLSQRAEQNLMEQQQQDNMNREFARDFMNQFRGERQSFRNQSLGYDMERSPDFSKSPEGLRPANNNIGASGRLNIVA